MWLAHFVVTGITGPGTIYVGQDLHFRKPVGLGDTITVTVTAKEKRPEKRVVIFDCRCVNQKGEEVITGTAVTIAPTEKIRRPRVALPEVQLRRHDRYAELIARCSELAPIPTAVVYPCDKVSLEGAVRAAEARLISPVLVGPEAKIRSVAAAEGLDIAAYEIVNTEHSHAAAAKADDQGDGRGGISRPENGPRRVSVLSREGRQSRALARVPMTPYRRQLVALCNWSTAHVASCDGSDAGTTARAERWVRRHSTHHGCSGGTGRGFRSSPIAT